MDTQYFFWARNGMTLASAEINHRSWQITFLGYKQNLTRTQEQAIEAGMMGFNSSGNLPNELTGKTPTLVSYSISQPLNWDKRWQEFIKRVNGWLGIVGIEPRISTDLLDRVTATLTALGYRGNQIGEMLKSPRRTIQQFEQSVTQANYSRIRERGNLDEIARLNDQIKLLLVAINDLKTYMAQILPG